MAYTTYNCTALTGGAERALDALSVATLVTGDRARCVVSGAVSDYTYSSTGTSAEQTTIHPFIIRPDDYTSGGNWTESLSNSYVKIGTLTRAMDAASGDVAYTGVGFQPSNIIFFGEVGTDGLSFGFDNATNHYATFLYTAATTIFNKSTAYSVYVVEADAKYQAAIVKTFDVDGFTLTWTRTGATASATATIMYLAIR